jgi:hypothetical protein
MPRWLSSALERVHACAAAGTITLTYKAAREAAGLGLAPEDVRDVLRSLSAADSAGRFRSDASKEWMYVFKPTLVCEVAYVKVVLRKTCVVVSFHGDQGVRDEEAE